MRLTDEYIFRQPEKYQSIMLHLVAVFERQIPEIDLLLKWGTPCFYFKKKVFCYLNSSPKKGFVDVGFFKGFQLRRNQQYLIAEKRNTIKSLRYSSLESIDHKVLVDVIQEALSLYK